ncbi:uncharacterized protein LOC117315654 [Pecten maximus]|uniref:uncharacterized protein LOC117315654 n=1 Tax=Pecten maximus TaxID=6579 RepID=UPI0014586ED7|nr:uncharacterized protein LOC117315654 [Pecten maximus]XP_033725840.1 uncharacterized protein LOC117315654 [Pecten maximus]
MIENNNGADVMKQASNGSAEIPPDIQKRLPQLFTSMELAFYLDNYQVLPMLVKYTDNYIIDKCLKSSLGKTNEAIIRGIRGKLSHEHKPKHVAFGRLRDPSEHNAKNVFVVFSTTKTHGAETSIAGYRVLFRDPEICEKDGIDEGRVVLHHCHENDYFLSEDEKVLIDKAIKQDCDKLWNRHSNIRGIMSSPVKYSKGQFLRQPCVVILCLFKTFIPENELDFPTSILVDGQYVPVDVREGYFRLVGDDNPLAKHVPLKMGCTIRTNDGTARFGTLGPFVEYENRLCGLVAAHVMFSKEECQQKAKTNRSSQEHVLSDTKYGGTRVEEVYARGCSERLMLQPGNGPGANQQDVDLVCGRVIKWDYAIERDTSIDIAVVEITKKERKPQQGLFTAYEKHQFKKIGYPDMEPTFDTGKKGNPTCDPEADKHPTSVSEEAEREKSDNDKRKDHTAGNNTIIFGGVSGPTIGKYRNSSSVQFTDKVCGRTEANERYRGMHFIDNSQCGEPDCKLPPLAQRGDSGGAVFQRLEDKSLVSIGVLVAVDNTGSALVTPINPVLDYFNLRMKKFQ